MLFHTKPTSRTIYACFAIVIATGGLFVAQQIHLATAASHDHANAAGPAPTPTPESRKNLQHFLDQLKTAEVAKTSEPRVYVDTLIRLASAQMQLDRESFQPSSPDAPFYSAVSDQYLKQAVDFFAVHEWDENDNDDIATQLWHQLEYSSPDAIDSNFEKLFIASERHTRDKFQRHDGQLYVVLTRQENKLPFSQQKRLFEKAIAIRAVARKDEKWRLASLYHELGMSYRYCNDDVSGAIENFLHAISLLEPDPVEQEKALIDLSRFYVDNAMYDKAESTWRRAASLATEKRLVWDANEYMSLINTYKGRNQPQYLGPLFATLTANGDDFTFIRLDPELLDYVETQIKLGELEPAADLIRKRIASSPGQGSKPGMETWKIRLSNIYLAQGKSKESQSLFAGAIADLERRSLPVSDYVSLRAKLLENMGMYDEAKAVASNLSKIPTGLAKVTNITLPAAMVIRDYLEIGPNSNVTSFDSTNSDDPITRMSAMGGSGGGTGSAISTPGIASPETDGSSILCLGAASAADLRYYGTIFCNSAQITQVQGSRAKLSRVDNPYRIQDVPEPPADARTTLPSIQTNVRQLERGDYILSDLGDLTIRPQTSSTPIRIFLQDSPEKNEFTLSLSGPTVFFKQFQLWYRGTKTIKLKRAQGLIYAPNATVELKSGTGFMGAIVAREFKSSNSSSIFLDRGVQNFSLTK